MTSMSEIPPGTQDKNRYIDVLPSMVILYIRLSQCELHIITDPNSRVVLFLKFGVPNSDYINANYVRVGQFLILFF